jgi:methionine-rich copper-binding protein CopC
MSFKPLIAASALALATALAPAPLRAHAYPMVAVPADGAVLRESPREIRIQFTEGIELEFSRIDVKNAAGEKMNAGNLRRIADDTAVVAVKALGPGTYRIEWQVLSVDTHVTEGVLRFTVSGGK